MNKLIKWFFCFIGGHDWTTDAREGKMPTDQQVYNGVKGFRDYAKMYCKRCGSISELSYW